MWVFDSGIVWLFPQAVGVDNTFRRKFDREEYLERAREREKEVTFLRRILVFVRLGIFVLILSCSSFVALVFSGGGPAA